ncbi:META domain-containing protein [Xanthomarina sp. F2636L]|uniref:META domain-containing protein n=1 Tax=Xanthomarina sp. F2636L TaxID=2996018 RepID=UPI00225E2718|nr:META domain-containing protein [Xanthomarina sp. F2636L]MCX7551631.1 META domain-containing protein [Xanthomarina sp. F2636L]
MKSLIQVMKIHFTYILLLCAMLSCKHKVASKKEKDIAETSKTTVKMRSNEQTPYFVASGTEPNWNLEIFSDLVVFKTPKDSIKLPHSEPVLAMDANVKLYKFSTEAHQINIQIVQKQCNNKMSEKERPYAVSVDLKKTTGREFKSMEGCGQYMTDYRLHDIWVLESLNGEKMTKADFIKEFPTIEINSSENSFMGFAGCNRIHGNLFFEKDLLRFTNIITTEMLCQPKNKEPEFLKALKNSVSYSIENNRLTLSNASGILIVFKKID